MYAVRPTPERLDLGDKSEPVAFFYHEAHAHIFGSLMWNTFYEVEEIDEI